MSEMEDTSRKGYAARGGWIGCLAGMFFWWIPIPVAVIVWSFGLKGPFGDYMLAAIPCFLALTLLGSGMLAYGFDAFGDFHADSLKTGEDSTADPGSRELVSVH